VRPGPTDLVREYDDQPYYWTGWHDGADDCEPPEPGKFWLTICDPTGEEVAIIVHRGDITSPLAEEKVERAKLLARLLTEDARHQ